ncbi:[Fe-Fe] hydrogenase large subunit C-terminal domain-containing protein [Caldicellulosiruptor acetigenus]|uniref:Methyl-accepting chemotaxis sensory transducer n=1 Tax=Caldicellulosiruptor acetigenus 6A TaxID=632516 RepID=G2PWV6_9FIRM|nr:[Fe-Fe] hydrogenase large subunit C-terminal domain-containing protein [Caldicellulosiruptor acetigenus]AEM74761.1 methyl-accepting chemotaxis sensory transducer [Caldicellulosiruptor acetigenus 6A]
MIFIDKTLCVSCFKCFRVCPVPFANKIQHDFIVTNDDFCIHCGRCVQNCEHNARYFTDDIDSLINLLNSKAELIAIVAPSARANFKIGKLINLLRNIGFKEVFDVSFGADITTWAYLKYIQRFKPKSVIAQPCPAVVNYIEKIQPELIKYLIPVQSPMMCLSIYLKKYLKKSGKIVFISPCIAKKDEISRFPEYVSLNVTYKSLLQHFSELYSKMPDNGKFDYVEGYLGKLFSRPGGLKENVLEYKKDAKIKQIEGDIIFEYLQNDYINTPDDKKPLIIDILNCQEGCNKGSACSLETPIDIIDYEFDQMKKNTINKFYQRRLFKNFDKNLKLDDFLTNYTNKKVNLPTPSSKEIDVIFEQMLKTTPEKQKLNCSACGYDTCLDMAKAIFYGLNKKENCINYLKDLFVIENQELIEKNSQINRLMEEVHQTKERLEILLKEVAEATQIIDKSMQEVAVGYSENAKEIEAISISISNLVEQIKTLDNVSKELAGKIDILSTTNRVLQEIGDNIALYALNAAIESSKFEQAKGFMVIATEIRKLAERIKQETSTIRKNFSLLIDLMNKIPEFSSRSLEMIENISNSLVNESALVEELTAKSEEISAEISRLNAIINNQDEVKTLK